ncbi:MAG: helix-turn-helix domain-containing protein [Bacteroidetes bacterium]|nr:helix-turn-helix domain-containing protein [Bacteroidota bacterium]
MKEQKFIVRNMTCNSCVKLVESELKALGFRKAFVKLGEVKIADDKIINETIFRSALQKHGFDLVNNYEEEITENIRLIILEIVNNEEGIDSRMHFSELIESKIGRNYKYLSKVFSQNKKISIEKFLILAKIEKAKELIQYRELTFSEIAFNLGYTNTQHLSAQFKKIVSYTMTDFRAKQAKNRISMNKL